MHEIVAEPMSVLGLPYIWSLCAATGAAMLVFVCCVGALTVVVFFHELGHLLAARALGAHVSTLSIGFGLKLLEFTDRYGTSWQLAAVPLGGVVKYDDDVPQVGGDGNTRSICENGRIRRLAIRRAGVAAAGPIANLVLATLIFASISIFSERETFVARVDQIRQGSDALMESRPSRETPSVKANAIFAALRSGAKETYLTAEWMLAYTWGSIAGNPLETPGGRGTNDRNSALFLADILGCLSVLLALLNLLPLLPLDGGRLLLCALEAACGSSIPERVQHVASNIGFALVAILPILAAVVIWFD